MSTIVQIQVNVNDAEALAKLTNIDGIGKRLSSEPIKINIEAPDFEKVSKSALELSRQANSIAIQKEKTEQKRIEASSKKFVEGERTKRKQMSSTAKTAGELSKQNLKVASSTNKVGVEAKKTSGLTGLLGDSFGRIVAKQAAWQLIGNGIAAVKNSFTDAFSTMREVDSELATVQKVTGATKDEMNALGDAAYSTASKYGVAANEYLQNVATFARAGYKDAAQGLGELAIKTQLVGDTDQETAAQFLLSADAAWKYNGNVEKLSLALDKANTIDNNYATSIQKIAAGLPIVANVASMAGMTMDQTMAMLGTITATTQESGTKAATAARALILNIMGDTTTEISEGVTATEESVASLSEVLQKYAPDVVEAAKATGELINPMEAIEALSKAMKDGMMSEADLMQMVSALGGKLRTNQLVALLKNFDTYREMLESMGVAAGSADNEVSIMLDTWDAKANILKNTWTEFISHIADTSMIKGGLDVAIGVIDALDSDFGHFAITVTGVTTAVGLFSKSLSGIKATAVGSTIAGMLTDVKALTAGFELLTAAALKSPLFWGAVATAGIVTIAKSLDALTTTYEEQAEVVKNLQQQYDSLYGSGSEYEEINQKAENLTEAEQKRLDILNGQKEALKEQLRIAKELEAAKFKEKWDTPIKGNAVTLGKSGNILDYSSTGTRDLAILRDEVDWLSQSYQNGSISQEEYRRGLAEVTNTYKDTAETLRDNKESNIELSDSMLEFLGIYDEAATLLTEFTDSSGQASDATKNAAETFEQEAASIDAATAALQRYKAELDGLTDKEANANAMQTAYNKAMEDFKVGKVGSAYVKSFYDQFIPDDIKQQFGYSVTDAMEWAMSDSNLGRIFGSSDMLGEFQKVIQESAQGGSLAGIVTLDDSGRIAQISSYEALAEQLNMTTGEVQSLVQGLTAYFDSVFYSGEEAASVVAQLGETLGDGSHSLTDYVNALSSITGANTVEGILSVFEGLERAGVVNWAEKMGVSSAEEARAKIIAAAEEALGFTEKTKSEISETDALINIDAEIQNAQSRLEELQQKKRELESPAQVPVTAPGAEEAKGELNEVKQAKDAAEGDANVGITADGADGAASELQEVGDAANAIPDYKNIAVSVRENASAVLHNIKSRIDAIQSKTVTITVVERRVNGNTGLPIPGAATGTKNAVGGKTLINEGKPVNGSSAELVLDKGQAYIANDGKPTVVDLSPGATVFTAKETQEIFSGAKKEIISAFAGGTGLGKPSSGNTGIYKPGAGGSTGIGGSTASNSDDDDPLKKEVREKLDNLDKQITLAQNRNDKALEQKLQEQAAKLVKEFVQKYLDKGYSNTSDEVLDLLNRGYGYSDDLMAELVDSLEALTDATDAANKLAEKQQAVEKAQIELENVKKQRTVRIYNPVTGQWEWVAKADDILKAQENLAKAEKDYQDEKLDQELEAIKNGNIGDIGDLTMSPALRELIAGASDEEQKRITDILHAISGTAKGTVDKSGESVFRSTDSHDVYYQFGDLKISEGQAKNMTVKQLADQLRALKVT